MDIPLEVVRSIVALPTAILQVRIDEVTRSNDLIAAEKNLIATQRQYIAFLLDPKVMSSPLGDKEKPELVAKDTQRPAFFTDFATDGARQAKVFDEFGQVCKDPKAAQILTGGSKT